MLKKFFPLLLCLLTCAATTQAQKATMRIDATTRHQHITGFGGFVCSPGFAYNHMSTAEIKRVWGTGSLVGCNIMRLFIPVGRNNWAQSLQTAKLAKQMGLIVFASPWGQPAEWKTNNSSDAKTKDGKEGRLKRENWADYAKYLDDYVSYLRQNGVELDAISIQNEPDWPAQYAGCLWSASEMAEFVKTYGRQIHCKIMAPETLAVSDSYANALNTPAVLDAFDIYGAHQYGGIQSAYKNLATKGKELWMTEYLINWNEAENNTRSFDFSKDFFNFFSSINTCMLGNFNAWVHYAAKRYYGLLGDGQRGTSNGIVTKRGYVMAHFARFVTGMTRIDAAFADDSALPFQGSAYLSDSGDTVVAVVANPSDLARQLTLDLPFYALKGELYSTNRTKNMGKTALQFETETPRPVVELPAQSVNTVLLVKQRDRQPSLMKGSVVRYDRIDEQKVTKTAFGSNYKLSGATRKFDHSAALISSRTNAEYGYVELTDRYSQLVMQVKKVTSTMNYTSALTTLYYVNGKGAVASHDYGELDLSRRENFNIVFDLSPTTLKDGCRGIIALTNNNWSSTLTISFGDVYFSNGPQYAATLSGPYVADDSYLLDYGSDPANTSISLEAVSDLPNALPWLQGNRVAFVPESASVGGANVVAGNRCQLLSLSADGGDFRPSRSFMADEAEFTCEVDGLRLLMLPFDADVPAQAHAYAMTVGQQAVLTPLESIPAHQPVLIEANGKVVFQGKGDVSYATSAFDAQLRGTYISTPLYAGDYVLARQEDQWGLQRLSSSSVLQPFDVYSNPGSSQSFIPIDLSVTGIAGVVTHSPDSSQPAYNVLGQRVSASHRGIIIRGGRKYLQR